MTMHRIMKRSVRFYLIYVTNNCFIPHKDQIVRYLEPKDLKVRYLIYLLWIWQINFRMRVAECDSRATFADDFFENFITSIMIACIKIALIQ